MRSFPTTMVGMYAWFWMAQVEYRGSAGARLNSEAALTVVQARLLGWGWSLRPKIDQ